MSYRIQIHKFGGNSDPLLRLRPSRQRNYIIQYFSDLDATTIVEETAYFDRDFLAEYSAFYSISPKGYPNLCRRLHFFSLKSLKRNHLRSAAGSNERTIRDLNDNYLGFVILRPIASSPFARTVVGWYPDQTPNTPRIINPSRLYRAHLAGFTLNIEGLAWQQQDQGVSACATVALWSMLHCSAFDEHFAIPSTVDITLRAHKDASSMSKPFPSKGLNIYQTSQAIKQCGLAPIVFSGDTQYRKGNAFSREKFSSLTASLIRSGYPVMIVGQFYKRPGHHAICSVGFRESGSRIPKPETTELQDNNIEFFYIHDDNIGPLVRFKVNNIPKRDVALLKPSKPTPLREGSSKRDILADYPAIVPGYLVAAVHEQMRTSPEMLIKIGLNIGRQICNFIAQLSRKDGKPGNPIGITLSFRLIRLYKYLDEELKNTLGKYPKLLSKTRLALSEKAPPMSLHVGLARFGWGSTPLFDILYDTTDSDINLSPFCCVVFNRLFFPILGTMSSNKKLELGVLVKAF